MPIDFVQRRIRFAEHRGGPQDVTEDFTFSAPVNRAESFINGFNIGFTAADHHLLRQEINTAVRDIDDRVVKVRIVFSLRNGTGSFDDPFDGFVDVVVVADVKTEM